MGYNTTVVVLNDALDQIAKDPNFGKNLVEAIMSLRSGCRPQDVPAGNHCNAAEVIETHHADHDTVVLVGGNTGRVVPYDAMLVPDGWQPIETAPKDGTRVWLWLEPVGIAMPYSWREQGWMGDDFPLNMADPTHWMPLPAAPSPTNNKGD